MLNICWMKRLALSLLSSIGKLPGCDDDDDNG